jgi:uncharacterized protein YggT (Ycf19 family)
MGIVDFILNLAGVLLWLNWRSSQADPLARRRPATLMGTLRPAAPATPHRWRWLLLIVGLLGGRAVAYWQFGSAITPVWSARLNFGIVILSIPCHATWAGLGRILLFSGLSFGLALGVFYLWLLLLSLLRGPDPIHRLIRVALGRVDDWPVWLKILLPLLATATLWLALSWLLANLHIIPRPVSPAQRLEQSIVIGLGSYLVWKYPLAALLALHLLNNYVYLGNNGFWKYVYLSAQTVLAPLKKIPLRVGKVDFAPVAGVALVFLGAELASQALIWTYLRLPF